MNSASWIAYGGLLGGLAVAAGAFGAHGLEGRLDPRELATFEVAVRYQMYHALALVLLGVWASHCPTAGQQLAAVAFLLGILLFSGCLYLLVFSGRKWLGAVVPFGGVSFLVGWAALAWSAWRYRASG